jgi:hypothetical protein
MKKALDGLDLHFIHGRSKNPNALPMIVTSQFIATSTTMQSSVGIQA